MGVGAGVRSRLRGWKVWVASMGWVLCRPGLVEPVGAGLVGPCDVGSVGRGNAVSVGLGDVVSMGLGDAGSVRPSSRGETAIFVGRFRGWRLARRGALFWGFGLAVEYSLGGGTMSRTRYISEFGVNMCANGSVLLQDEHLSDLNSILPNAPEFHIYVIGARPRISVDPSSFRFDDTHLSGVFLVHLGAQVLEVPVTAKQPSRYKLDRIESDWPHTAVRFFSGPMMALGGKVALLADAFPELFDHLDLEVLYVGQSYGSVGDREAQQRLQSHTTLQQILGESSRRRPDREVWLALFHFEETLLATFDGRWAQEPGAVEADEGRIERALTQQVSEQQRINFTEAALIRYFEPRFNKTFRSTFPSPAHTSYDECYQIDLNMISVEVETGDIRARLYSAARPPEWRHLAMFPLHDPKERKYMLDLLQPSEKANARPDEPGHV